MVKFLDEPRLRELVGYIKGDIEDAGKKDDVTVTRNSSDELQANSIIHVEALPTLATDIKPNSIYELTETVVIDEGLATIKYDQYGHITGSTGKTLGRGLSDSSNTIGHSNTEVTAKTNTNIVGMSYDKYGHITGKGSTEYSVSDTYTSNANNQLFTRHGANTFYSNVFNGQYNVVFCGNFTRTTTHSISSNTATYIPLTGQDQYRGGLCYRSGNAIYIATTGTYMIMTSGRLSDTGASSRHWYLGAGTTNMWDDSSGGTWNYTYNRHKAQSIEIRYLTAGTLVRPWVYIDSNSGTMQYVTMSMFKLNEK